MNAMQCQIRQDIMMTAKYRGFHFDKVAIVVDGDYLLAEAWVGRQCAHLRIGWPDLLDSTESYRNWQRFCEDICEQLIGPDKVMSKVDTIRRREQGLCQHIGQNTLSFAASTEIATPSHGFCTYWASGWPHRCTVG